MLAFYTLCDRKKERKGRERLFNKVVSFVYFWYGVNKVNAVALHANSLVWRCLSFPADDEDESSTSSRPQYILGKETLIPHHKYQQQNS